MRAASALMILTLVSSCSLDRGQLAGGLFVDAGPLRDASSDSGAWDAGRFDSGPPRDTGTEPDAFNSDAAMVDAARLDAARPDAARPDAAMPDAARADAGPPRCRDIYGAAASYLECAERAAECEFYVDLGGATMSCSALCAAFGGTCLRSYREAESSPANCDYLPPGTPRACGDPHDDEICVCTR